MVLFFQTMALHIPLIALEEHFVSQAVTDYHASINAPSPLPAFDTEVMESLQEVGDVRLRAMDKGQVSLQIISHRPILIPIPPDVCKAANDELAEAIKFQPDRFAAFCMLPTSYPEAAAQELERCVNELGFKGSLIGNLTAGRFLDDEFFWPVFRAHESLDVPCYLHPALHPETMDPLYNGNYSGAVADFLANHGFGWHAQTALHVLRLFAAKLFDHFPRLKIIIGHMGEMLPFQLDRIHRLISKSWPHESKPQRHLMQVWHENIWITTAGMFSLAPMACLVHMCRADRVLYSVDYPFCSPTDGLNFMEQLHDSGMICEEDFVGIAYRNAERLLGVEAPQHIKARFESPVNNGYLSDERQDGYSVYTRSPLETVHE